MIIHRSQYWDMKHSVYLTNHFVAKADLESLTDEQIWIARPCSYKKEPFSLSYYHGIMLKLEADRMLLQQPKGSFLLRSVLQQYWISYKNINDRRIIHSQIIKSPDSYHSIEEIQGQFTSIRNTFIWFYSSLKLLYHLWYLSIIKYK